MTNTPPKAKRPLSGLSLFRGLLWAMVVVVAIAAAGLYFFRPPASPTGLTGGSFTLQSTAGGTFTEASLKGTPTLLFFGYTFCPDICPTTLAQLRQIKSELPKDAVDKLQIVLVSVDPNRDNPQQLKQYLGYFDPQFVGLTPKSIEELQKVANAVSIPFIPADTSKPNYTVDHSGNLAVIGPDGTQRGFIRAPLNNAKLVAQLPVMLNRK